jgi:hypothetical protein
MSIEVEVTLLDTGVRCAVFSPRAKHTHLWGNGRLCIFAEKKSQKAPFEHRRSMADIRAKLLCKSVTLDRNC